MQLTALIESRLTVKETAATPTEAVTTLAQLLYREGRVQDAQRFCDALQRQGATFVLSLTPTVVMAHGYGEEVLAPAIAVMRTRDGKTVFLLASRNAQEHLEQLSQLAGALLVTPSLSALFE
ncbi:MAG: PTS sugar transporter subunit IIA [Eubacterium sp.]|nr:PTS sugar transporter subunit IIA [Eubacterium sp.]